MRCRKTLQAVAVSLSVFVAPVAATAETMADALVLAYRHSGLLEQNRALLRAADENVAVALSATRAAVSYSIGATLDYTPDFFSSGFIASGGATASISAQLTIFDFGANQLAIDVAKETVLATRETLVSVEQEVMRRAIVAYLTVLRNSAFVDLREANVQLIARELDASRERFDVGEITRTDVSLAESHLAAARSDLAAAQGDLLVAREEYRAATGQYPGTLQAPSSLPNVPASLQEARAIALRRHPAIRQAQRQVTVTELNIERAIAAMKPKLTGSYRYTLNQDWDRSTQLALSFGGSLYQGGRLSALYRQAQANRDAQRAALHITRHDVEQSAGDAWSGLTVANASLLASQEQVRASTLALRGVQEEASLGARTTLDVLDAEQELLNARTNEISAGTQRTVAIYSLLTSLGLLTAEHLNLGITTYDPAAYYNAVRNAPTYEVSPQGDQLDRVLRALNR